MFVYKALIYQKHFLMLSEMVVVNEEVLECLVSQFMLSDGDCCQQSKMLLTLEGG